MTAGYDDFGAFSSECQRCGATDARKSAGNENNLLSHILLLFLFFGFCFIGLRFIYPLVRNA